MKVGDVIKAIDGTKLAKRDELMALMAKKKPGETVKVVVDRDGEEKTFGVKLGERPAE